MKNKFILLELNQRNEIRADVNLTIKSLGITEIENINVHFNLLDYVIKIALWRIMVYHCKKICWTFVGLLEIMLYLKPT